MSFKSFLVKTSTASLKAVRALWTGFLVMMAGFGHGLVECVKHASAADVESDEYEPYGSDSDEYYAGAAQHDFKDGWGS